MFKNCVFIHIPRTGGSSIWHSLVALAGRDRGICDIYHETRAAFGTPMRGGEIIDTVRRRVGEMPCLFHHHTDEPVLNHFEPNHTVIATVLRDPVDRFVSEVFHSRSFLRTCREPEFVSFHERHWGRRYVQALLSEKLKPRELLAAATTATFLHNYYTKYFSNLLNFRDVALRANIVSSGEYLLRLAEAIQSRVAVIRRFESLQVSYSDIVTAFALGSGQEPLERAINVAAVKQDEIDLDRSQYKRFFRSDYELLQMLYQDEALRIGSHQSHYRHLAA